MSSCDRKYHTMLELMWQILNEEQKYFHPSSPLTRPIFHTPTSPQDRVTSESELLDRVWFAMTCLCLKSVSSECLAQSRIIETSSEREVKFPQCIQQRERESERGISHAVLDLPAPNHNPRANIGLLKPRERGPEEMFANTCPPSQTESFGNSILY